MKTYEAQCVRDGRWWAVRIPELNIYTQGRDLNDAEFMARDAVALVLEVSVEEVAVDLVVEAATETVDRYREAREAKAKADKAAAEAMHEGVRALLAKGMSQRDAARLLEISHQRVSQIARARADCPA